MRIILFRIAIGGLIQNFTMMSLETRKSYHRRIAILEDVLGNDDMSGRFVKRPDIFDERVMG